MALMFLWPVTMMVQIHTYNFLEAMTTGNRQKTANVRATGLSVQKITGRGYAQDAMLDYQDNLKLFIDNEAAKRFSEENPVEENDISIQSVDKTPKNKAKANQDE